MTKSFAEKTVEVKLLSNTLPAAVFAARDALEQSKIEALVYENEFVEGAAHQPVHGGQLQAVNCVARSILSRLPGPFTLGAKCY